MSCFTRWIAGIAVVAGLGVAIIGCNNTSSPTKADRMGDKMGSDKMSGDKMGGDKMGGDRMKDKPGG